MPFLMNILPMSIYCKVLTPKVAEIVRLFSAEVGRSHSTSS